MRIAAIPIATADLGSDGGVIDGCARVHWRGRAMFPAAGDGSGTFVFRRHHCRQYISLHVLSSGKVRFSGRSLWWGLSRRGRGCFSAASSSPSPGGLRRRGAGPPSRKPGSRSGRSRRVPTRARAAALRSGAGPPGAPPTEVAGRPGSWVRGCRLCAKGRRPKKKIWRTSHATFWKALAAHFQQREAIR